MRWIEEQNQRTEQIIAENGDHIIAVPAKNNGTRLDLFDLYDSRTHIIIAENITAKDANIAITICNTLIDNGEKVNVDNLRWLFF